ncbi:MAG: 50S ribosomal protein L9 [Deltaproteobacteria bacterium]|jgi:large subunit ribosomal protein L9|nr:50S ribosomal protein L9 [Deltaproteobacteria bacterium]MBW2512299.1 50S ribosomal protein L9 [Deltaproteobacteria bacterium]MDH4007070.1 50S ribosomal protein L9 [Desulfuromonadales bacterium]
MDVILTENVKGLGSIGEVVKVKPGYGRNYLVPQGLAVVASDRNLSELEHHKRQLSRKAEKLSQEAADVKARIEAVTCNFVHKASEEGKLFGSVTSMEIADALAAQGIEIDRRKILLEQPIKNLGEHDIDIRLNAGVNATVKVVVASEDALAEPAATKAESATAEEEK